MDGFRTKFGKATMEAVGTLVLVLTIQLAVNSGNSLAPAGIGLVLMTMVYDSGPISGAHYNPAISLAVMLRGKQTVSEMIVYWIFQFIGGTVGALLGGITCGSFVTIGIGSNSTLLHAMLAELLFAFVLCFVVLGVATHSASNGQSFFWCCYWINCYCRCYICGIHFWWCI